MNDTGQQAKTLSSNERTAVLEAIRALPSALRNPKVAKMLSRSVHEPELATELRARPRELFTQCGVEVPADVEIAVHYLTPKSIHLVLPSADLTARGEGPLAIADEDLVSAVNTYSFIDDDNWISDGRDPTTAADTGDDPGGWSDNVQDDGRKADGGRDPRANNDA